MTIKGFWQKIKDAYGKFEDWVHSWFPGFKTRIMAFLGAIGSAATALQQYVTGLPVNKYITTEHIAIASAVLFTLAFWFSNMGTRVEDRNAE